MSDLPGNAPDLPRPSVVSLGEIQAPWGKTITLDAVTHDSGLHLLRMRIREGRRFTDMDLDTATVHALIAALDGWLRRQPSEE